MCDRVTRAPAVQLQLAHEGDQGRLLLLRQLHAQHEVEKLHRILQRQEAPIVQIWWRVLDPPKGEGLDGALGVDPLIVDRARLIEALDFQIMHLVVEIRRGRMTRPTAPLPEEHLLAQALLLRGLGGIEGPEHRQFRGRGEIERSEEHTSELQSHLNLVCRLLLEKKKKSKATQSRDCARDVGLTDTLFSNVHERLGYDAINSLGGSLGIVRTTLDTNYSTSRRL